jgi:hypothetical protein
VEVSGSAPAPDNAGFDRSVSLSLLRLNGTVPVPSTATISVPLHGIPYCNSAVAPAADENVVRILSTNNAASAVAAAIAGAIVLDSLADLLHSRKGPWEVTTPRSSCPGEDTHSSPGRSKPPAFCKIKTLTQNVICCGRALVPACLAAGL